MQAEESDKKSFIVIQVIVPHLDINIYQLHVAFLINIAYKLNKHITINYNRGACTMQK